MEKRKTKFVNSVMGLPLHLAPEIFSKLPVSSLPACRLVCKSWNDMVLDYASFSKVLPNTFFLSSSDLIPDSNPSESTGLANPKIHCIDIDTLSSVASTGFDDDWSFIPIINSCHALLFISKVSFDSIADGIFNPMTNEFFEVPQHPELENEDFCYGFGFSPTTKEYKLFRAVHSEIDFSSIVEILRFRRNGTNLYQWMHLQWVPFLVYHQGTYLNGVIYWIGRANEGDEFVIYGLDVDTEKLEWIATLDVGPNSRSVGIEALNGSVYATFSMHQTCWKIQVWMMRSHEGKNLWTKEFANDDTPNDWEALQPPIFSLKLLKVFEDGDFLYLVNDGFFCLYDPKTRSKKIKEIDINVRIVGSGTIESLSFGSLPNILAGDH